MNTLLVDVKEVIASFHYNVCFIMWLYDDDFKQRFKDNLDFYVEKFTTTDKNNNYIDTHIFSRLACRQYMNGVSIYWHTKAYKIMIDDDCWEVQTYDQIEYKPIVNFWNHMDLYNIFGLNYCNKVYFAMVDTYIVGMKVDDVIISLAHIIDKFADCYLTHEHKFLLEKRLAIIPKKIKV